MLLWTMSTHLQHYQLWLEPFLWPVVKERLLDPAAPKCGGIQTFADFCPFPPPIVKFEGFAGTAPKTRALFFFASRPPAFRYALAGSSNPQRLLRAHRDGNQSWDRVGGLGVADDRRDDA